MQAVEAAHVLAVAAGLAAPAGGVGAVLLRKLLLGDDHVAVDVGDGHLGRGDEVEVVEVDVIHLPLLVRELARAVAGGGVDHEWGFHLSIAGFPGLVEEELDEGALQACSLADIEGEAGACHLHSELEVDEVVFPDEVPVGECVLGEVGHRAAGLLHHIVVGGEAFGHIGAGEVGDGEQQVAHLHLTLVEPLLEALGLPLDAGHFLLCLFGALFVAGLHGGADRGGELLERGGVGVAALLEASALGVDLKDFGDDGPAVEAFDCQPFHHKIRVGLYCL